MHQAEQEPDPDRGRHEAGRDQRLLEVLLGQPLGGERRDQDADGRRGEDHAGLDRAVVALGLEEDRHGERHAHQQQPLEVLSDQAEVRRAVLEQGRGQQRLLPGSLASADEHEEGGQERGPEREEDDQQRVVDSGLQDPDHQAEHPDRGQDRSDRVERTVGSGGTGSTTRRASTMIVATTRAWNTNAARQLIPEVIRPPINGPAAAPMPPSPLITPNALARDSIEVNAIVVRM